MGSDTICVVFSRDRALQLDGTIRSFFLHCQDPDTIRIAIIYEVSTPRHKAQYDQLIDAYKNYRVDFVSEMDFRQDLLNILDPLPNFSPQKILSGIFQYIHPSLTLWLANCVFGGWRKGWVMFLVDDTLFVRNFSVQEIRILLERHPDALGYSLRLGANTQYCYTDQSYQPMPDFNRVADNVLKYKWVHADKDFGYPLELSSSVYRLQDIVSLLHRLPFNSPNELESRMASRAKDFIREKPFLLCAKASVAFSNPVNVVQSVSHNRMGGASEYSANNLANLFDQGYRLRADAYSGTTTNSCHQEIPLELEKQTVLRGLDN